MVTTQRARLARRRRVILIALFATYLVALVWTVLWKLAIPSVDTVDPTPLKWIPFVAANGSGASRPLEVLGNVALFVPFGIYLGLLGRPRRWWGVTLVAGATSVTFEVLQHVLVVGSFDTTDMITNTTGALLGFGLLVLVRRRRGRATAPLLIRVLSVGTALTALAIALFVASPLHYAAPSDVSVPEFQHLDPR